MEFILSGGLGFCKMIRFDLRFSARSCCHEAEEEVCSANQAVPSHQSKDQPHGHERVGPTGIPSQKPNPCSPIFTKSYLSFLLF